MRIEHAELSLVGDREDNQDRVSIAVNGHAALMIVIDGMGGHSDGSRAADTALQSLLRSFSQTTTPLFDPIGFLHLALSRAHDDVARLGSSLSVDSRPRATIAVSLVQDGAAYWAHIGDSRIYLIRSGRVVRRTRDHSHVELLLREGKITESEVATHPMRNFVECCLGGDPAIPEMSISTRQLLQPGDVLLLCTDGIWANMSDQDIGMFFRPDYEDLRAWLEALGRRAVQAASPFSDNSTAAVLRWQGN
ncbi:MAG: protein phosphatase 2C domain-containing protein [Steroidobacteraceae bacterium]